MCQIRNSMKWSLLALTALCVCGMSAAELKPATVAAFDRYIQQTEQRLDARKSFLWADESAERVRRARQGEVVVDPTGAKPLTETSDG